MTLNDRVEILALINDGKLSREEFIETCRKDCAFFINACLFVYEPRASPELRDLPFVLRKCQEKYVRVAQKYLEGNKDLLTEKTREMGITWIVCAIMVWAWIFQPKFTGTLSSITEDKIDAKSDPNCLFWKLDYLVESLRWTVPFLFPRGYIRKQPYRTHMRMVNPVNGSVLRGEVMGQNLGRSGRVRMMFLDEFAEAPYPEAAWASSSKTTNCRFVVFTPRGMNFSGKLANPPKGEKRTISKITLHWLEDETKNKYQLIHKDTGKVIATGHGRIKFPIAERYPDAVPEPIYPWYEDSKFRLAYDPIKIAQELDVNYDESMEGAMYPQIARSRIAPGITYDPAFTLYCSMDYGIDDKTSLVWFQYDYIRKVYRFIDCFESNGKTIKWYVPFILGESYIHLGDQEGGYSPTQLKMIREHTVFNGMYTEFYGDPAGRQRSLVTATSVIDELRKYGIHVITNTKINSYEQRRFNAAQMLLRAEIDEDKCANLIDAVRNSKLKQTSDQKSLPVHGPESHFRTALEYAAVNTPHGYEADVITPESVIYANARIEALDKGAAPRGMSFKQAPAEVPTHGAQIVRHESGYLRLIIGKQIYEVPDNQSPTKLLSLVRQQAQIQDDAQEAFYKERQSPARSRKGAAYGKTKSSDSLTRKGSTTQLMRKAFEQAQKEVR